MLSQILSSPSVASRVAARSTFGLVCRHVCLPHITRVANMAELQPLGATRARSRIFLAEAAAAAPGARPAPRLSHRSVLAATEPSMLTPAQSFWSGMAEIGLGTRRDGDLARLQDIFAQNGSSVPLDPEGRRREPSTARQELAALEAEAAELQAQLQASVVRGNVGRWSCTVACERSPEASQDKVHEVLHK